ncbi:MAG: FAD-binding oxidoreductase [Chloroflexi bacterium]|nr:FAD-binding oxidoreductase [Chloroflexota bacterium]
MSTKAYQYLTPTLMTSLERIAGRGNVLTSAEDLEKYSLDEMAHRRPYRPGAVVIARDADIVSGIMRLASRHRIPVTPRGGGTGLSGGCIPLHGGIVLSLEKMDRILEIDETNQMAVVEPGVTLGALQEAAGARGLSYPVYPGEKSATLGGNIATNAGGMRAVKYGVTRHFVLGLEAVLAGGQVVNAGGKFVKCTTGYDFTQLLTGSEGTLAVITKATLRLGYPPASREILFVPFPGLETAIEAVPDILRCSIIPAGLEFMERDIIQLAEEYTGREIPCSRHGAFLLIILEGNSREEVLQASRQIENAVRRHHAVDVFVPPSEKSGRDLLDAREKFYQVIRRLGRVELIDTVVPRSLIPRFLGQVKDLARRHGIEVIAYGHAGDGNVHLHPVGRGLSPQDWETRLPALMKAIYETAIEMGGAISGEHGLGFDKRPYFQAFASPELLGVMKAIKHALDPDNILNPGKLF